MLANKTVNAKGTNKDRTFRSGGFASRAARPTSSGGAHLQLPLGQPDDAALRSITREWLVPRLIDKFLGLHGVELLHVGKVATRLQSLLPGAGPPAASTGATPLQKPDRKRMRKPTSGTASKEAGK